MTCKKPSIAWKIGKHKDKNGRLKDTIVFSPKEAINKILPSELHNHEVLIPCGKCEVCLKKKRMEQSIRIIHEIENNEDNCFITLTYNQENIPLTDGKDIIRGAQNASETFCPTLCIDDYQRWLKRFRKQIKLHYNKTIRYFIVGEYGSKGKRPHYHAIIFGWKPDDLVEHKFHKKYWTYRSAFLEKTWTLGFSEVGIDVNVGVAKYCAQYVTKKFVVDNDRPNFIQDEFVRCSKMNGGLGAAFVHKFHQQISSQGFVLILNRQNKQGFKFAIPKYYLALLEKFYKDDFEKLKSNRECYLEQVKKDNDSKPYEYWEDKINQEKKKIEVYRENLKRSYNNRSYECLDNQEELL